tara:strand:+ start:1475 stop:3667 length:2193 start_codon:yes stop_codon:yes gene_type:complete
MANIKKNFNFRNGVQVDDDNLLVTDTGLVGIGTTIPNESLDVRGNVVVTGFTSSTTAQIGVLTVTTFVPNQITGAGLSVFSGIVTAQGAGILTYFGDARNLQGMPTSQWEDKDVGLGFTSIYNTGGNVGVGTEDPRSTFQVGNNADAGEKGVGISSVGNINATGIITASSFIGNITGDVVGRITGDVVGNTQGIHTGAVNLGDDVKAIFGDQSDLEIYHTSNTSFVDATADGNGNLILYGNTVSIGKNVGSLGLKFTHGAKTQLFYAGLKKFETESFGATVTGELRTDDLNVSGVSTFTGLIDGNGGATIDNVQIGVTGDNEIDTSSGNLTIDSAGGTITIDDNLGVTGTSTFSDDVGVVGLTTTKTLLVTGITTLTGNVNASFVGASSTSFALKMGVGTTEAPVNDIQVRKSGDAEIQVTSETGSAGLTVGRETGNLDTNNAEFRYGEVSAGSPYSSAQSLDILNYGTGNFNYHISANNAGAVDGDFHWHKGKNSARLMTLTGIGGSLGIGITQPTKELDVVGAGNFSGNLSVGNNLSVGGLLIGNVQGTLTGNVSGTLAGNANATVGVSTLNNLTISGVATVGSRIETDIIGIGTDSEEFVLNINDKFGEVNDAALTESPQVFVTATGSVGIRTTSELANVSINAHQAQAVVGGLGVGSTVIVGSVDMRAAGRDATTRFMLPPQVNTSQRASLTGVISGAVIFNTSLNKLQVYVGSGSYNVANWQNLH